MGAKVRRISNDMSVRVCWGGGGRDSNTGSAHRWREGLPVLVPFSAAMVFVALMYAPGLAPRTPARAAHSPKGITHSVRMNIETAGREGDIA